MDRNFRAHLLAWLALPPVAVLNGTLRDFTYGRAMPEALSHSVSVVPLVLVIALWAAFMAKRRPLPNDRSAAIVGIVWLTLTVGFETTLGFARGVPLSRLVADYDVTSGNLWAFVPLTTLLAPIVGRLVTRPAKRRPTAHVAARA